MRAVAVAALLVLPIAASTAVGAPDAPGKPDAWFCYRARAYRALYPSDKAAEAAAIARGADRATIAQAHRCKRQ